MIGIKTTVDKIWFCKGQRVPSDRYKENYDKIKWENSDDSTIQQSKTSTGSST